MLKKLPKVGQYVRALDDVKFPECGQFLTKGKIYKIVGTNIKMPYIIDDNDEKEIIDSTVKDLYELIPFPKVNDWIRCNVTKEWEDGVKYQLEGKLYQIKGISESSDYPYFIGECGGKIYIDELSINEYEIVGDVKVIDIKKDDTPETVTHEFTYPKIALMGTEVNAQNFYEDVSYFNFEFKFIGDGDKLFDELSSLQADIVKLLSERYS